MTGKPCRVDGCERETTPKAARGMCTRHYQLFLKWGEPMRPPDKVCVSCGKVFQSSYTATACSETCARERQKGYNRRWREEHPRYHSEYNRRWRKEHADEYKAYYEWYRENNADKVREIYRNWSEKNPDYGKKWREANPDRCRERVRRRRARLKQAPTYLITQRDISRLLGRYKHSCAYCGSRLGDGYHIDHVFPVSMGGSNSIGNIVPACGSCNSSKSNWFLSEWRYRDFLSRPLKRRKSTHTKM